MYDIIFLCWIRLLGWTHCLIRMSSFPGRRKGAGVVTAVPLNSRWTRERLCPVSSEHGRELYTSTRLWACLWTVLSLLLFRLSCWRSILMPAPMLPPPPSSIPVAEQAAAPRSSSRLELRWLGEGRNQFLIQIQFSCCYAVSCAWAKAVCGGAMQSRWEHLRRQQDRLVLASSWCETVITFSLQHFLSFFRVLISLGQDDNCASRHYTDGVKQKGLGLFLC